MINFDNYNVNPDLRAALDAYIEHGNLTSPFLKYVLQNDLTNAVLESSPEDLQCLGDLVRCLYFEVSAELWGSADRVHRHSVDFV